MESMIAPRSRAWVEVSLAAVVENARTVARTAGTRLLPIVKANAYGLGAVAVSRALEAVAPWGYGVATVEEGVELRAAGITRPVLVLLTAAAARFAEYRAAGLTPVFDSAGALESWLAGGGDAPFHLEIDTGMGGAGVRWNEMERVARLVDTPRFEGAFTQFHSSECADGSMRRQLERYRAALARLPRSPRLLHVANSAAALTEPAAALDLVRPGVFLYGGTPGRRRRPGTPGGEHPGTGGERTACAGGGDGELQRALDGPAGHDDRDARHRLRRRRATVARAGRTRDRCCWPGHAVRSSGP